MAAVGSGLPAGGFFALVAFFAEEAPRSCILASFSTTSLSLLSSLLLLLPSPNSETWARGEDKKWEQGEPVEIMNIRKITYLPQLVFTSLSWSH